MTHRYSGAPSFSRMYHGADADPGHSEPDAEELNAGQPVDGRLRGVGRGAMATVCWGAGGSTDYQPNKNGVVADRLRWGRGGSYSIRIVGNVGATPSLIRMGKEDQSDFDTKKDWEVVIRGFPSCALLEGWLPKPC